jgi:hypothetical protein
MSQENVDLVLRACAAWQRFEPEEIAAFYAADAEIVSIWAEVFGRTFHGRDGLLKWIRDFSAAFERPTWNTSTWLMPATRWLFLGTSELGDGQAKPRSR